MFKQIFAASVFTALSSALVFAFPGGGSEPTSKPSASSPKKLKCKRNETVKRVRKNGRYVSACVKLKAGVLPDDALYQQARMLADEGEYEWALDHLSIIINQDDKEVLNYTGYAHRKAGRVETGIAFYQKALAIDPNYVEAREYLGEAYVLTGFAAEAQRQLEEIAARCGKTCETYKALDGYMKSHGR